MEVTPVEAPSTTSMQAERTGKRKWDADRALWTHGRTRRRTGGLSNVQRGMLVNALELNSRDAFPSRTKLSELIEALQTVWKRVRIIVMRSLRSSLTRMLLHRTPIWTIAIGMTFSFPRRLKSRALRVRL